MSFGNALRAVFSALTTTAAAAEMTAQAALKGAVAVNNVMDVAVLTSEGYKIDAMSANETKRLEVAAKFNQRKAELANATANSNGDLVLE